MGSIILRSLLMIAIFGMCERESPYAKSETYGKNKVCLYKKDSECRLPPNATVRYGTTRWYNQSGVGTLRFSPDGTKLALAGLDVRIMASQSGKLLHILNRHKDYVNAITFSSNGKLLASVESDVHVCLWDTSTGKLIRQMTGHKGEVCSVAFSPDCKLLATTGDDLVGVRLWDVNSGLLVRTVFKGIGKISSITFSPDNNCIAVSIQNSSILQLLYKNALKPIALTDARLRGSLKLIFFSPNGKTLIVGDNKGVISVWDVRQGTVIRTFNVEYVWNLSCSPDGRLLASATNEGCQIWDIQSGKRLNRPRIEKSGAVQGVCFSADSRTLAGWDYFGHIRFWDVDADCPLHANGRHLLDIKSLVLVSGNSIMATASEDQMIILWDVQSGRSLCYLKGHEGAVHCLAASRNGNLIASGGSDATVRLWNIFSHKAVHILSGHTGPVLTLAFSPNGKLLASGGSDGTIRIWDTVRMKLLHALPDHFFTVRSLAFSSDGLMLASTGNDKTIRLWDASSGKMLRCLRGHREIASTLSFSPDGRLIAADDPSGNICLWRVSSHYPLGWIRGNGTPLNSITFSPDGKTLISGGSDGIIRVWETATRMNIGTFSGHIGAITSLAFFENGRAIISGSSDWTALKWDVTRLGIPNSRHRNQNNSPSFERLWKDLASDQPSTAYRAIWSLASNSHESLPWLKEHLKPIDSISDSHIGELISRLDDDRFEVREHSSSEILKLNELVVPALRHSLVSGLLTPEQRLRVRRILQKHEMSPLTSEQLRFIRVTKVLEEIGNEDARHFLESLAKGAPASSLTQQAKAALVRLKSSYPD